MTNRARWLMVLGLCGLLAGVFRGQAMLSLISLATYVWLCVEWFRFQARIRLELPRMQFERLLNGASQESGCLWVGRKARIEVRLQSRSGIAPLIRMHDVVPEILRVIPVNNDLTGDPGPGGASESVRSKVALLRITKSYWRWLRMDSDSLQRPQAPNKWLLENRCRQAAFCYQVIPRSAGQANLPGIRLTLQDPYGFFRLDRFMDLAQSFRILPDYFQSGELRPTIKRQNSLPRHGIHRLQRSGAGSELLELREYVAGDPPKSIAWKASARRDKLMTRKYESEVPVRVHLLIDGATSTRVGGYGFRLLDQINFVAASIAKAATAVGDPISGMLVDETGIQRLPWLAGDRGFVRLLQALSDFSRHPPAWTGSLTPRMIFVAKLICQERFPELLDRRYHPLPFSFFAATRERIQMAGVLAEVFQLSARVQMECCYDSATMASYLQRFLFQAGLPLMDALLPETADSAVAAEQRMHGFCEAISKAIAHARDNEVFVVLADLLSCAPNMGQLVRVVKLAKAKHHRVAFICPTTTFLRPTPELVQPRSNSVEDLLFAAERTRVRELALEMKRELVRLGVAVSFAGERPSIQMVLAEVDLARDGKSRMSGAASRGRRL